MCATTVIPAAGRRYKILKAEPEHVALARRMVVGPLAEWGLDHLIEDAQMIMSELVTNAIGATPRQTVILVIAREPRYVFLGVWDGDPKLPVMKNFDDMDEDGRGLFIVTALAALCGAKPMDGPDGGKTVWARMER